MTALLTIHGLSAGYGEAIILNDVHLRLKEGETLALLGRNGTGKTTLMNAIAGANRQFAGEIQLDGVALDPLPSFKRAKAGIGWVPQERNIFKSLTVHENLTAVWHAPKRSPGHAVWTPDRVYEMFPRLADRKGNMGNQLSGGEQQMLAIGRALVLNPRVLLLDEPLEGLAPIICEELLRAIQRITRDEGMAAIVVEQHPQAVLGISDHALVLDQGRVIHEGDAQALSLAPDLLDRLIGLKRH